MAESIYNPNTADIDGSFQQIKTTKMTQGFATIDDMNLNNIAEQNQIAPRAVRTGEMRGDQQLRGLIKVEDRSGRTVVMMGYSPGSF
jgi:hypothetical protein